MDEIIKKDSKKPVRHIDRIILDPEPLVRIDHWVKHLKDQYQGVYVGRKEILFTLVMSRSEHLTKQEEKTFVEKYYNEERLLQETLKKIKDAKLKGETPLLAELLPSFRFANQNKKKAEDSQVIEYQKILPNKK